MAQHRSEATPAASISTIKPVAIIGLACRLPAQADNVENLWTSLASGQNGSSEHPKERLQPEQNYHPNPDKKGTFYSKGGSYLQEDVTLFDAAFFGITATEAISMDPQQRHLLEVSYEALENAGLSLASVKGSKMGVFVGGSQSEYRTHILQDRDFLPMFEATGSHESLQANRVSYTYDLKGPSLTIDTACSSSLAALNSAFQSLQSGESSAAIVGSSVIRLVPESTMSLCNMKLLSPEGRSYAFDERGSGGFGRGEGSACLILKTLEEAVKSGDPIRAIICNTGVNQDGKTNGITAPNGESQTALIRSVYDQVRLDPSKTDYIEAHGTGTKVGDPVEMDALGSVFGKDRTDRPVIVGSIKSNIGHLEAASGVASIVKTALSLERKFYIPNSDLQVLKKDIPFKQLNMKVSDRFRPWDSTGIRRASVNNFGFGGTNTHIIMEEALSSQDVRNPSSDSEKRRFIGDTPPKMELPKRPYVFLASANDRESLKRYLNLLAEYVVQHPSYLFPNLPPSLAFTLGSRRTVLPWKVAIQATDQDDLIQHLKAADLTPVRSTEKPRVGFVFTGQGSQWPRMGTELHKTYPVYASAIEKADRALAKFGSSWSLIAELEKTDGSSLVDRPYISQPACTALQIALVDLFHSWGITASSVSGHSSGEIAAAYAAGILDLETCVAIAYYRGSVAAHLAEDSSDVTGGMLALGTSQRESETLIEGSKDAEGDAAIACINSPSSMTVSGDATRISEVSKLADERSIWNRRLKVDVAYHSHHMNKVAEEYSTLLGNVKPRSKATAEFYSSLKGCEVEPATLDTSYWIDNLTSPVKFSESFAEMCKPKESEKRGIDLVVELGPHSTLQGPIRQITRTLEGGAHTVQSLSSIVRKKDAVESMLDLAAQLVTSGCEIRLESVNFPSSKAFPAVLTDLPVYQWDHTKSYWHDGRIAQAASQCTAPRHDLLGIKVPDSTAEEPRWKNILTIDDVPWLRDHSVQDVVVFPMAGYLCMAIEACRQRAHWRGADYDRITLRDVSVQQALTMSEAAPVELKLSLTPRNDGPHSISDTWSQFNISSWTSERGYSHHCTGYVSAVLPDKPNPVSGGTQDHGLRHHLGDLAQLRDACTRTRDTNEMYQTCDQIGFQFGPSFRRMQDPYFDARRGTYLVNVPDTASRMPFSLESDYFIHPISLDVVFQGAALFLTGENGGLDQPYMPISFQELTVRQGMVMVPGSTFRMHALSTPPDSFTTKRSFDYAAVDTQDGSPSCCIVVKGLVEAPVEGEEEAESADDNRCLRILWEPSMQYIQQGSSQILVQNSSSEPCKSQDLRILDELALGYVKEVLSKINKDEVPDTYLRRLYGWLESQIDKHANLDPNGDVPEHVKETHVLNGHVPDGSIAKKGHMSGHQDKDADNVDKDIIHKVGSALLSIVQGQVDPLAILSEDDLLDRFNANISGYHRLYSATTTYLRKMAFRCPILNVLDISNDKSALAQILPGLADYANAPYGIIKYDIASDSSDMSASTKAKLAPWANFVSQVKVDTMQSPQAQGFAEKTYDVIIASTLDHDASLAQKELENIRLLLKETGTLIVMQGGHSKEHLWLLPLAICPDWWKKNADSANHLTNGEQESATDDSFSSDHWLEAGFAEPHAFVYAHDQSSEYDANVSFMNVTAANTPSELNYDLVIVAQWLPHTISRSQIEGSMQSLGCASIAWVDFTRLQEVDLDGKYCVIIDNPQNPYLTRLTAETFEGLKRLTQANGTLWITGDLVSPDAGLARGLMRTLRAEFQIDKMVTLAVDDWNASSAHLIGLIKRVVERSFFEEIIEGEYDREMAIKDGILYIPRLLPDEKTNQGLIRETQEGAKELQPFHQAGRSLRLAISSPGLLNTLCFVDEDRFNSTLPDDAIEIEVKASGLNFKDVILALGQLPGYYLGQECSGIVTKTGTNVQGLQKGDRICAIVTGSIASTVQCKADCAVKLPDNITFAAGASIPLIYCTAQYCLANVARLRANETILIHAAAGGVGQAAVMLAMFTKAKIFATVGSPEKKDFLVKTYNIPPEHIFYSRDTSFMEGILEATDGKGVDVVLNSLAGEQLRASWRCVAPFGRFIEIGKRDITTNMHLGMAQFERTVTFAAVDLGDLIQHRPAALQEVFVEVMKLMRSGAVKPVSPIHEFAASEVETAFRSLQSGKQFGKLVIIPRADDMVMASRPSEELAFLREDVSYLITGGTGGIGRAICAWMGHHGAKNIILSSRSGKKQGNTVALVEELATLGVKVEVYQSDVAILDDVKRLISDCAKSMPPIGGVIHAAWFNHDVTFESASYQDWTAVVQPKYQGAWNLHTALSEYKLDFFIMTSSISSVIGNRGQAAYAAANSSLDDFAHYRASLGLAGTSLNLGVVKEIGHVADRPELQKKLESLSGNALTSADVLALIKLAILGHIDTQAGHQSITGLSFENFDPQSSAFYWATDARFCHLRRGMGVSEGGEGEASLSIRQSLKKAQSIEAAVGVVITALVEKFSSVLIIPEDEVSIEKPIVALGLDSLVAVEVRSWIAQMEAKVSTMELMSSRSIQALAEMLVGRSLLLEGLRGKGTED